MLIYQLLPRLYGNTCCANVPHGTLAENGCGKLADLTTARLGRLRRTGYTHLWLTGLIAHATTTDRSAYGLPADHPTVVKGRAGSPYAIRDYYDIDADLATDVGQRMAEFEALLARIHQAGLKCLIDFVPNHTARRYHSTTAPEGTRDLGADDDSTQAFAPHNNYYYCPGEPLHTDAFASASDTPYDEQPARATGNDCYHAAPSADDWYETAKLNYGIDHRDGSHHFVPVPDTWRKMTAILHFWAAKGVDGFRCDMAEMVPADFWHYAIASVKAVYPDLTFIAEIYSPDAYRHYLHHGGFDYLYDKVGLYDTLRAVVCGHAPATAITLCWQRVDDIRDRMLYFLENHDEQRIASDFYAADAILARPALAVAALMGRNPLMVYAGQEVGERGMDAEGFSGADGRTTIFDYWSPDALRRLFLGRQHLKRAERDLCAYYDSVLALRRSRPVAEGKSFDLMYANTDGSDGFDPHRHYAFLRASDDEALLVVANFSNACRTIGVRLPAHAFDYLGLPTGTFCATDCLTGASVSLDMRRDGCTFIYIRPHSATLLSWHF